MQKNKLQTVLIHMIVNVNGHSYVMCDGPM